MIQRKQGGGTMLIQTIIKESNSSITNYTEGDRKEKTNQNKFERQHFDYVL